jgi:hypothetical protein
MAGRLPNDASLGAAYALAGRADDALPLIAAAIDEVQSRPTHRWAAQILLHAGTTCLLAGRIDDATGHAQDVLKLARRLGARGHEAHALRLAGDLASLDDAERAAGYYRDALARADTLSMRPLVAHCHLGLGKLARGGAREQADTHMTTATAMYGEMDMRYWREQAQAASRKGD